MCIRDRAITEGEENNSRTLSDYLQTISLLTDQDEEIKNIDFVTLMSVHAAKGLEFHTVFIVGMEENLFPSYMSMADPDQLDEERRLFYVAITRAKRQLVMTYASMRYLLGSLYLPSRSELSFLNSSFSTLVGVPDTSDSEIELPAPLMVISPGSVKSLIALLPSGNASVASRVSFSFNLKVNLPPLIGKVSVIIESSSNTL